MTKPDDIEDKSVFFAPIAEFGNPSTCV